MSSSYNQLKYWNGGFRVFRKIGGQVIRIRTWECYWLASGMLGMTLGAKHLQIEMIVRSHCAAIRIHTQQQLSDPLATNCLTWTWLFFWGILLTGEKNGFGIVFQGECKTPSLCQSWRGSTSLNTATFFCKLLRPTSISLFNFRCNVCVQVFAAICPKHLHAIVSLQLHWAQGCRSLLCILWTNLCTLVTTTNKLGRIRDSCIDASSHCPHNCPQHIISCQQQHRNPHFTFWHYIRLSMFGNIGTFDAAGSRFLHAGGDQINCESPPPCTSLVSFLFDRPTLI